MHYCPSIEGNNMQGQILERSAEGTGIEIEIVRGDERTSTKRTRDKDTNYIIQRS
jgi:hypothetical protein